jgi:hypothetical protein
MRKTLVVSLAVLAVVAPSRARAQAPDTPGAYISAGLGAGGEGVAGLASLGFRRGDRVITARVAITDELNILGPSPSQSRSDVSVLVGRIVPGRYGFATASAGLGLVHTVSRGQYLRSDPGFLGSVYERRSETTAGVALSVKAVLSTRYAGIGLEGFGNLNPKASFVGLAMTLDVGKLR